MKSKTRKHRKRKKNLLRTTAQILQEKQNKNRFELPPGLELMFSTRTVLPWAISPGQNWMIHTRHGSSCQRKFLKAIFGKFISARRPRHSAITTRDVKNIKCEVQWQCAGFSRSHFARESMARPFFKSSQIKNSNFLLVI